MAQQIINIGTSAGDGTGDKLRAGFDKVNDNFTELYPSFGATNPANVIIINAESDFPNQTSTTITLDSGLLYFIGTAFSTVKNFVVMNGVTIESTNTSVPAITYTGSGSMFTSSETDWDLRNIGLSCPSATIYSITGGIVKFFNVRFTQNANIGGITKGSTTTAIVFDTVSFFNVTGQGMTFFGAIDVFSITRVTLVSSSVSHIFVDQGTATFQTFEVMDVRSFGVSGSVALSGLASSANILIGGIASIESSTLNGNAMTPLATISPSDIRYDFENVEGVTDSASLSETHLSSAQTVTINTISVFEVVNGTNWADDFSDRFTITTLGVITYVSEQDAKFKITANATVEKSGGGADQLEMRIRVNSTDEVKTGSFTENATPTSVQCAGIFTLTNGDTIRTSIANNNSTANVIVSTSILQIVAVA